MYLLQVAIPNASKKRFAKVKVGDATDCAFETLDCQLDVSTSTAEDAAVLYDNIHQVILRHANGQTQITGGLRFHSNWSDIINMKSLSSFHIGSRGRFYVKKQVTMSPNSTAWIGNGGSLVVTDEEYTITGRVEVPDNGVKIL